MSKDAATRKGADIPFSTILGRDLEHPCVGEDASIQEFHDIEWSSDDKVVFAENDGLWYGNLVLRGRCGV